jgi:hypothetical protein
MDAEESGRNVSELNQVIPLATVTTAWLHGQRALMTSPWAVLRCWRAADGRGAQRVTAIAPAIAVARFCERVLVSSMNHIPIHETPCRKTSQQPV